jgi:hypothetical protein
MAGDAETSNRYAQLAGSLAGQALSAACDARPHQPRPDQWQRSLTVGVAAARSLAEQGEADVGEGASQGFAALVEAAGELEAGRAVRFTDGFGHSRPIYTLLLWHLHLRAAMLHGQRLCNDAATAEAGPNALAATGRLLQPLQAHLMPDAAPDRAMVGLWLALCEREWALALDQSVPFAIKDDWIDQTLTEAGAQSLQPRAAEDAIDDWTYRELVALHALDRLAEVTGRTDWHQRAEAVATYHEGHTQPDYITYQPWALAAFARQPATVMFAEQQLHDVTVHLATGGPAGALVPALLLADAAASLRGAGSMSQ